MTEVNQERGEVGITLDNRVYPMRPSYEAMLAIEDQLGPILSLSMRLRDPNQMLGIREIAVIVTSCIQAAGKDRDDKMLAGVQINRIRELLFAEGISSAIRPMTTLMYNMLTGGAEAKKKSRPEKTPN